jgi:uncharacterized protein (DUF849 family)
MIFHATTVGGALFRANFFADRGKGLRGHPRVGLEDNIYLEKGKLAPSNASLVEKAAKIIEVLGDHVATPNDARQILGLAAT